MALSSILTSPIVQAISGIVDKVVPDKKQAAEIKARLASEQNALVTEKIRGAVSIIVAEAQGSWLQRNWRPLLMLVVIVIIANNYVLIPYARAFGLNIPLLELPNGLWSVLTVGVGGYVVGRSAEKVMAGRP